jgi:hypothetical protein
MACIRPAEGSWKIDEEECVECGVCLKATVCPTDALFMPEESLRYPRSLRAAFSDPAVQFPEMKQGGRGTEEMKTNDVTGKFRRGEYGMTLEFGRPGTGTRLREIEKVTRHLCAMGVHLEEANALSFLFLDRQKGTMKPEVLDQKVLSAILEIKISDEQLERVVNALHAVLQTVDTVVSWGLIARFEPDGSLPVVGRLEKMGIAVRPNAKINVGLGKPQVEA